MKQKLGIYLFNLEGQVFKFLVHTIELKKDY